MRNFLFKAVLMVAMPLMAVSFASCSDDDDDENNGGGEFHSELVGTYSPDIQLKSGATAAEDPVIKAGVVIKTAWAPGKTAPALELAPGMKLEWTVIEGLASKLANVYCGGGLEYVELTGEGHVKASYFELADDSEMLTPTFEKTASLFPEEDEPEDMLTYMTQDGKVYLGVSRALIDAAGSDLVPGQTFSKAIIAMLGGMKIDFRYTDTHIMIPLKYRLEGTAGLYVYVDRDMMLPVRGLLKTVIGALAGSQTDNAMVQMILPKLSGLIDELFDNSTELELGLKMKKSVLL